MIREATTESYARIKTPSCNRNEASTAQSVHNIAQFFMKQSCPENYYRQRINDNPHPCRTIYKKDGKDADQTIDFFLNYLFCSQISSELFSLLFPCFLPHSCNLSAFLHNDKCTAIVSKPLSHASLGALKKSQLNKWWLIWHQKIVTRTQD